jgi:hypothetical protein
VEEEAEESAVAEAGEDADYSPEFSFCFAGVLICMILKHMLLQIVVQEHLILRKKFKKSEYI